MYCVVVIALILVTNVVTLKVVYTLSGSPGCCAAGGLMVGCCTGAAFVGVMTGAGAGAVVAASILLVARGTLGAGRAAMSRDLTAKAVAPILGLRCSAFLALV